MAPTASTATQGTLSFAIAKKVCTAAELERLACAFLNHEENMKFDSESAAAQMGTDIKPASFKRVLQNTIKKIREATANPPAEGDNDNDATAGANQTPRAAKGKPGRKRKSPTSDEAVDGDDEEKATPKPKKAKGGKRAKKASPVASDGKGAGDEAANGHGCEGEVSGWNAVNGNGADSDNQIKLEEGDEDAD